MRLLSKFRKNKTEEINYEEQLPVTDMLNLKANLMSANEVNANSTCITTPPEGIVYSHNADGLLVGADLDSSEGLPNLGSSVEEAVSDPEEYIWVEGYKGMDKNMVCKYSESWTYGFVCGIHRQSFPRTYSQQYVLNEETSLPENEKAELCKHGFHFCLKLNQVFSYYSYDGSNRFFKVKAYVNKADYEKWVKEKKDKMVASKIIPYEEILLDYDTVMEYQSMLLTRMDGSYKYVFTNQDFQAIYIEKQNEREYFKEKFNRCIMELGWGQNFAELIWHQFDGNSACGFVKMFHIHYMLKTFMEEGLSKDTAVMCIYSKL